MKPPRPTLTPPDVSWTKVRLLEYLTAMGEPLNTSLPKPALLVAACATHRRSLAPAKWMFIETCKAVFNDEEAPTPDLPVPPEGEHTDGWYVITTPVGDPRHDIHRGWSTSIRHGNGAYPGDGRITSASREGTTLYSTREKALAAARFHAVRRTVVAFLALLPEEK